MTERRCFQTWVKSVSPPTLSCCIGENTFSSRTYQDRQKKSTVAPKLFFLLFPLLHPVHSSRLRPSCVRGHNHHPTFPSELIFEREPNLVDTAPPIYEYNCHSLALSVIIKFIWDFFFLWLVGSAIIYPLVAWNPPLSPQEEISPRLGNAGLNTKSINVILLIKAIGGAINCYECSQASLLYFLSKQFFVRIGTCVLYSWHHRSCEIGDTEASCCVW